MIKNNEREEIRLEIKKGYFKLLYLVLIISLLATGCNSQSNLSEAENTGKEKEELVENGDTSKAKEEIIHAQVDDMNGLFNPILSSISTDIAINKILYPSLMKISPTGQLENYFAEDFILSEDSKTLTYKIKQNAEWQDGEPVTAHDVVFTFTSMANPNLINSQIKNLDKVKGAMDYYEGKADSVAGIYAEDDYTVVIELDEVAAPSVTEFGTRGIMPKHIWSEIPVEEWEENIEILHNPVGFGPYFMDEFVQGEYIKFSKNPKFFDGDPKTDKFIIKLINPDSIMAELKNGTVDISPSKNLRKSEIDSLKLDEVDSINFPDAMYRYIGINMRKEVFQDLNLRKAMIYAIDRAEIVDKILEGNAEVIDGPFIPGSWLYPEDIDRYEFDLEKSKEILKDAGYTDKDGNGILENPKGEELSFTWKIPNDSASLEQAALTIVQNFKEIGIDIDLIKMEYSAIAREAIFEHDFDLYSLNCFFNADGDLMNWWHSKSISNEEGTPSWNFGAYSNENVDKLLEKSRGTLNDEERKEYFNEIAEYIHEDVPMLFLYVQDNGSVYNNKLKNYNPTTFNIYNDIHKWVIEE